MNSILAIHNFYVGLFIFKVTPEIFAKRLWNISSFVLKICIFNFDTSIMETFNQDLLVLYYKTFCWKDFIFEDRSGIKCSILKVNNNFTNAVKTMHYMEPIEIAVAINCPDPQNVWNSTLDIITNNKAKIRNLWVKNNILQIVVTNFVNIQLIKFSKNIWKFTFEKNTYE